jgi:hypothetical protein
VRSSTALGPERPHEPGEGLAALGQLPRRLRVPDRGLDLRAVADDSVIRQQAGGVRLAEFGDGRDLESGEGCAEGIALAEDRQPGEP